MDLSKVKKIYMIGIKGVGMTMLAQFLVEKGYEIAGSDTDEVFMTDKILKSCDIPVHQGFNPNNVPTDVDLIIHSSAYNKETNEEVARALEGKIKVLTYAEVLSELFKTMHGIAVCGSHGKTTTSAWLSFVLMKAGVEPNAMIGSNVEQLGGASISGKSDYLIIEADEYQNKLKYYDPKIVLLTNIDYDHPDFYKTEESYIDAFIQFITKIPKKGFLVASFDDENIARIANVNCMGRVISYGIENKEADLVAYDINQVGLQQTFKVKMDGEDIGDFRISLLGNHSVLNALAVIATCIELEVELKDIRNYLEEFRGTDRRMAVMGKFHGATIIDDYGHHPTEIKTTLDGVKKAYPDKKLTVVFHPHTFTRTRELLEEFGKSFGDADKVVVLDIYGSAREEQGGVHSKDLIEKIRQNEEGKELVYTSTLEDCEKYLRENIERDEIVLLMGAGDIFRVGENLVK